MLGKKVHQGPHSRLKLPLQANKGQAAFLEADQDILCCAEAEIELFYGCHHRPNDCVPTALPPETRLTRLSHKKDRMTHRG
jgi:hypothetical protein